MKDTYQSESDSPNPGSASGLRTSESIEGRHDSEVRSPTLTEELLSYLAILLRYKWVIIGITTFAAVTAVAFSIVSLRMPPEKSFLPNYYRADAMLLVAGDTGGGNRGMLIALGLDASGGVGTNYGELAQSVVRSRTFLDDLVDEHGVIERYEVTENVRSNSREIMTEMFDLSYDSATGILTISVEHIDPVFARDVANGIVSSLQAWFRSRGGLTRLQELRSLEAKNLEVEEEIARLESEIQAFQREHGVLNVEEIAETQARVLSDLQSRLVNIEVQIRNQESFSRIEDDPALARLRAERATVVGLMDQIEQGDAGGVRPMPARDELPGLAQQFRRLQTDLSIQQRIYEAISEQHEVARLTAEYEPAFTVLELAEVPDKKAGPSRARLSATVTAGAFAASVVLVFIIHFVRGVLSDPSKRRLFVRDGNGGEVGSRY